ncbi:hypothetical protein scyTo_0007625 [Scyliorhinus torazame]|uniref:Uncharacterized protein n=1 Tax=Scyliorhinus torazame TaxID=75743 RepID=A0A401NVV2_SCYTO|nr:hypothetical protein [Scyliorhinus torazame]
MLEKIEGTFVIANKPERELIQLLLDRGYDSRGVKSWKESQEKQHEAMEVETILSSGADFNQLLYLRLWYLTKEKKDELLKHRHEKKKNKKI